MIELILKLCALFLLTTAQRIQTIHVIRMSRIKFKEQKCVIQVLDKLKHTTRPGHTQNVQELESFEETVCGNVFERLHPKE